jgi:arsenate reductase
VVYGIPTCGTVKKARAWLDKHGVDYRFHDLRKDGVTEQQIKGWMKSFGWEALLNKHSKTWRELPASDKDALDEKKALKLMLKAPTLIKRPVVEHGKARLLAFDESEYKKVFK